MNSTPNSHFSFCDGHADVVQDVLPALVGLVARLDGDDHLGGLGVGVAGLGRADDGLLVGHAAVPGGEGAGGGQVVGH